MDEIAREIDRLTWRVGQRGITAREMARQSGVLRSLTNKERQAAIDRLVSKGALAAAPGPRTTRYIHSDYIRREAPQA